MNRFYPNASPSSSFFKHTRNISQRRKFHRQQFLIFSLHYIQYFIFPLPNRAFKLYQLYPVIDSNGQTESTTMSKKRVYCRQIEAKFRRITKLGQLKLNEEDARSPFGWKSRDVELSLLASAPQTRAPSVPGMLRHRGDWHRVHVEHRNSWN